MSTMQPAQAPSPELVPYEPRVGLDISSIIGLMVPLMMVMMIMGIMMSGMKSMMK